MGTAFQSAVELRGNGGGRNKRGSNHGKQKSFQANLPIRTQPGRH